MKDMKDMKGKRGRKIKLLGALVCFASIVYSRALFSYFFGQQVTGSSLK